MIHRLTSPKRRAFTLIETLVTMVIVLALLAFAMSALSTAKKSAAKVKCVANLRQVYASVLAFTEDYQGKLPPTLGPATSVDPSFTEGQYWWAQAYLGRYAIGPRNRAKSTAGVFSQAEVEVYNCPARFADRQDRPQSNGNPSISYTMASFYSSDPGPLKPDRYLLRVMENPSKKLFITEGRGMSLYEVNTIFRPLGDTQTGLRRFHDPAINVLFLDGHIESFTGKADELKKMHPGAAN